MTVDATQKRQVTIGRRGFGGLLAAELKERFGLAGGEVIGDGAVAFDERASLPLLDETVFARQYLVNAMRIAEPEAKAAAAQIVKRIQVMIGRQNRRAAGNWTMHAFALDDDSALAFALAVEKAVMAELKVSQTKFIKRYVAPSPFRSEEHTSELQSH